MNSIIRAIEDETLRKEKLSFNVGDSVKVHNLIREGEKERVQIYEGVVLKIQGGGNRETFTVRKNSNGVGVEKTFPVNSPMVVKVEVVRKGKARRAKLNYLRDRIGKAAKVKEHIEETVEA
ncbi:MAG: 50S ribosomal protein L19 [Lachnospiraceae bacterium]|nr:50S ribosomal protein L19 [Lachnospiraceae bacterium]